MAELRAARQEGSFRHRMRGRRHDSILNGGKRMAERWSRFDECTDQAYMDMISETPSLEAWTAAYQAFTEVMGDLRKEKEEQNRFLRKGENGSFRFSFEELEDEYGEEHDLSGWLEDYLDELDMQGEYEKILEAVEYLAREFEWENDDFFDLKSRKCMALMDLGRLDEAYQTCREWMESEEEDSPERFEAAADMIRICTKMHRFDEAAGLIEQWICSDDECTDDDYGIFAAARDFYKAAGDAKKAKKLQKLMDESDRRDEEEFMKEMKFNPDDFDDSGLPFS